MYYEVFGKSRKAILTVLDERNRVHRECCRLAESLGFTSYVMGRTFTREYVAGFEFGPRQRKRDVDGNLLRPYWNKRTKNHEEWYSPNKRTRDGKELDRKLRGIEIPGQGDIAKIVGIDPFADFPNTRLPGVTVVKGKRERVLVSSSIEPSSSDCRRISDIAYERLAKE